MTTKTAGMTIGSEALRGDVYRSLGGGMWELVLTATGISVVDSWKMPPRWRSDIRRNVPYVPGKTGAIFTGAGR